MIGIDYGDPFPWEKVRGEHVVMCDFSLPWEDMVRLYGEAEKFVWIDHHRTAIEAEDASALAGMIPGIRKEGIGACELTWRYLYPGVPVPLVVQLLARYDVWDHTDYRTLLVQSAINSYQTDPVLIDALDLWDRWITSKPDEIVVVMFALVSEGMTLRRNKEKWAAHFAKESVFTLCFEGLIWLAANADGNSQYFDSIVQAPDCPRHDGLLLFRWRQGKWIISLYADQKRENAIVCGDIAKRYGGGGHPGAAGFTSRELPFRLGDGMV
jgi:oligoribonuclease NrnB/cAMP/cGMP phosphodiesterase (DHH superfamily)